MQKITEITLYLLSNLLDFMKKFKKFILIFQKTTPAIILGILFLILPHLFGYPEGEIYYGVAPPELAGKFSARSSSVGLISWLILGLITSQIWSNLKKA